MKELQLSEALNRNYYFFNPHPGSEGLAQIPKALQKAAARLNEIKNTRLSVALKSLTTAIPKELEGKLRVFVDLDAKWLCLETQSHKKMHDKCYVSGLIQFDESLPPNESPK